MTTAVRKERTRSAQQVARFTGEGAYHGSTRSRPASTSAAQRPAPPPVDEVRPTTLERLAADDRPVILPFDAHFPNLFRVLEELPVPTEEAIQADRVTFVWSPFAEALDQAGPLTRSVLEAMRPHLTGRKRHIYIDSKIQFFAAGDVPVDSQHWHLDGTIVARDERAKRLGHPLLHDMRARLEGPAEPPIYLAYQSSTHCATRFLGAPLDLRRAHPRLRRARSPRPRPRSARPRPAPRLDRPLRRPHAPPGRRRRAPRLAPLDPLRRDRPRDPPRPLDRRVLRHRLPPPRSRRRRVIAPPAQRRTSPRSRTVSRVEITAAATASPKIGST